MLEQVWGQWSWAGYLVVFGLLLYMGRKYENEELEANLGIENGRRKGISEMEIAIRSLHSIEKWLKFATMLLAFLALSVLTKA